MNSENLVYWALTSFQPCITCEAGVFLISVLIVTFHPMPGGAVHKVSLATELALKLKRMLTCALHRVIEWNIIIRSMNTLC